MEHKLIDLTGASLLVKNIKDWVIDQKTHSLTKIDTINQNVTSADDGTTIYSNWEIIESIPTNSCIHIKSTTGNSKYESDYIKIKEGVRFPISNDGLAYLSITYVKSGNVGMQFEIDTDYFNDTIINLSITFYKVESIDDVYISDNIARTDDVEKEVNTLNKKLESKIEQKDLEYHINFSDSEEVEDVNLDYYTKAEADDRFIQKDANKGLSSNDFTDKDKAKLEKLPETAISDAPMGGELYGRANGEWVKVGLWSSLKVNLTIEQVPEGTEGITQANPEDYTLVISYLNVERRIPYKQGLVVSDIPAGLRVRVSMIPPKNFTAPRTLIYDSYLGVPQEFNGISKYITNGVYILDKDGGYTPWTAWSPDNNANAIGVGYMSSDLAFVMSKKFASLSSPTGRDNYPTLTEDNAYFGSYQFDCSSIDMIQAKSYEEAITLVGAGYTNNKQMVESHKSVQPNWENEKIVNSASRGYFPLAMMCYKFKTELEGDSFGSWRLMDARELNILKTDSSVQRALGVIGAPSYNIQSTAYGTCIPVDNDVDYIIWGYPQNGIMPRNAANINQRPFGTMPVRDFFSV